MATSSPDPLYTVRCLVARIRREAGAGQSPVGEKTILKRIHTGDLRAAHEGNRYLIRWSDWLAHLDRLADARRPETLPPSRAERVVRDVREQIRREAAAR